MPSYMPGIELSLKQSDFVKDQKQNDVTYLHFVWSGVNEKISVASNTTTEEIGGAILATCGLLPEDLKDICVTVWDGDKQILGAIEANSDSNPYSIKFSSCKFVFDSSVTRGHIVPALVTD